MTSLRCFRSSSVLLATLALLSGCGGGDDELPREPVSGMVTLDGKPLAAGRIAFQPPPGAEGMPAGAAIEDGAYSIPRDEGPTPGTYVVRITSLSEVVEEDPNAMPGEPPRVAKEPIPPKYNVKTSLNASITPEGPNSFDFDLKSK